MKIYFFLSIFNTLHETPYFHLTKSFVRCTVSTVKTLKLFSISILLLIIAGCATKPPESISEPSEKPPVVGEISEETFSDVPAAIEEIQEEIIDDGFLDEPEVLILTDEQEEYARSLGNLDASEISEETFTTDKEDILAIIDKLDRIMTSKDYTAWVTFVSEESQRYWSNPVNLEVLSERLPSRRVYKLRTLNDYFEKFFIPSRKGRVIDEIRYVTADSVKAVQYKDHEDIIYYQFERRNGTWVLLLDTNNEE